MTYNFIDDPSPNLNTTIDPTGNVVLADGTPQVDLLTDNFGAREVSVSISPPSGWSLERIVWTGGGSGTFGVPAPGSETDHPFSYTVSQNGTQQTASGTIKIKRQSGGDSGD